MNPPPEVDGFDDLLISACLNRFFRMSHFCLRSESHATITRPTKPQRSIKVIDERVARREHLACPGLHSAREGFRI